MILQYKIFIEYNTKNRYIISLCKQLINLKYYCCYEYYFIIKPKSIYEFFFNN